MRKLIAMLWAAPLSVAVLCLLLAHGLIQDALTETERLTRKDDDEPNL